jgi:hypothetical protein
MQNQHETYTPTGFPVIEWPDDDLCIRVRAEYLEMPGLSLTLTQAARLFDAEPSRVIRAMDTLVEDGFMLVRGRSFRRAA